MNNVEITFLVILGIVLVISVIAEINNHIKHHDSLFF